MHQILCDFTLETIHSFVMCTDFEIASVIFEICIIREPATTPGPWHQYHK